MVIEDKIELRQLARRQWKYPEDGLRELQAVSFFSQILPQIGGSRTWRREPFKKYLEEFQAALFSYAIKQQAPDYEWCYSYGELVDYDCVLRCQLPSNGGGLVYKPVQLKELVPEGLSAESSLQQLIDKLPAKYTGTRGQENLVVAIYVNRATDINFQQLKVPKMRVQQLWFYGFLDPSNCFLLGDILNGVGRYDFPYPNFSLGASMPNTATSTCPTGS